MDIFIPWWGIPSLVTFFGLFWVLFLTDGDSSVYFHSTLVKLLWLTPVSIVSSVTWVVCVIWMR